MLYTFLMKNYFKEYRLKRGISVKDMSKLLNVSRQTYTNYENGSYEPSYDTLLLISKILQVSIDDLLGNSEYRNEQDRMIEEIAKIVNKNK